MLPLVTGTLTVLNFKVTPLFWKVRNCMQYAPCT